MTHALRKLPRRGFIPGVITTVVLVAGPVLAQRNPADAAVAEAMFRAGRKLMDEGRYAQACDKLAGSYRLEPAGGTLLNLALCHEKQGRLATAWLEYQQAAADAIRDKREDRERFAQQRMEVLQPRLPKIVVKAEQVVEGMTIRLGDLEIPAESIDLELPFDPGSFSLTVQAPGYEPISRTVVAAEGSRTVIRIPALQPWPGVVEKAPVIVDRPPRSEPRRSGTPPEREGSAVSVMRTSAWVGGAAGIALVGVGSYFGVRALQKKSDADDLCGPDDCRSEYGSALDREAHDAAVKANLFIGGGAILTGLAAFTLVWTTPADGGGVTVGMVPSGGIAATYSGHW